MQSGYEPRQDEPTEPHNDPKDKHNLNTPFDIDGNEDAPGGEPLSDEAEETTHWRREDYNREDDPDQDDNPQYGSFNEERDAWGSKSHGGSSPARG